MHTEKHSKKAMRQGCKQIQRIRARDSYLLFKEVYDFLKTEPGIRDILKKFYDILNARHSFGSQTNAASAAESLEQVLKDYEEVLYV